MSYKYVVEIRDTKGTSFKIMIVADNESDLDVIDRRLKTTGLRNAFDVVYGNIGGNGGTWRTVDRGFICYPNGVWGEGGYHTDLTRRSITVSSSDHTPILELSNFMLCPGRLGDDTNKNGRGYIEQKAVLAITPGEISWTLVETNELW